VKRLSLSEIMLSGIPCLVTTSLIKVLARYRVLYFVGSSRKIAYLVSRLTTTMMYS
jgi:hypothetical protein